MKKPLLKQFCDLKQEDFERHPVWVASHSVDYDEPWYDETDEETFRPWGGNLPVNPADGMFLVKATVTLPDGSQRNGFLTPASDAGDLGSMQPQVFLGTKPLGFWGGMVGVPEQEREAFYRAVGRSGKDAFPIVFAASLGLASGECSGTVDGFYRSRDLTNVEVEW